MIAGVIYKKLKHLDDNAANNARAPGHSYEVFGNWHNKPSFPRKTQQSVLSYDHKKNGFGLRGVIAGPSDTWIIVDAAEPRLPQWPENYPNPYYGHGVEGGNVAFADGHAEWIPQKQYSYRYELSEDEGRNGP